MSEGEFEVMLDVRWSDLDINWHMRNTAYAEFGTQARVDFLSRGGFPPSRFQELGFGPVIFREESRYIREFRLGERVRVNFKVIGLSEDGSRWAMRHELFRDDGEPAAILELEGGWLDVATRRLRVPPDELRDRIAELPKADDFRALKSIVRGDRPVREDA